MSSSIVVQAIVHVVTTPSITTGSVAPDVLVSLRRLQQMPLPQPPARTRRRLRSHRHGSRGTRGLPSSSATRGVRVCLRGPCRGFWISFRMRDIQIILL